MKIKQGIPLIIFLIIILSYLSSHSLKGQAVNIFGDVREAHNTNQFMTGVEILYRKKEGKRVKWITKVVTNDAKPGEFTFSIDSDVLTKPDSILLKFEKKGFKTLKRYHPVNKNLDIFLLRKNTKKNTFKYGGVGLLVAGAALGILSGTQYEKHKNFNNGFKVRDEAYKNANLYLNSSIIAGAVGLASLTISFTIKKY